MMIVISESLDLTAVADPTLRAILERYVDLMDLATIYVVCRSDTLASIELERGMPFDYWEMIEHHYPDWFEAIFVLSDDGAGHIVLVPDRPCIDPDLLALCRDNATKPGDMIDF